MADHSADGEQRTIRLEYHFDRLLAEKLAQAYELLVPERRGFADIAHARGQEVLNDENSRPLRPRILRSAEGGPHNR